MANNWVSSNAYLGTSDQQNNAICCWNWFGTNGWTLNAVAAMLGNMQTESTINPGIWESLTVDTSRGFGLVQWTPATKIIEWAPTTYQQGNTQCARIDYETTQGSLQWFSNSAAPITSPPITFAEFKVSTLDVATLANYFLWYYEHPANVNQPNRATQAETWYSYLLGREPEDPGETGAPSTQTRRKMPLWFYCKPKRRRWH